MSLVSPGVLLVFRCFSTESKIDLLLSKDAGCCPVYFRSLWRSAVFLHQCLQSVLRGSNWYHCSCCFTSWLSYLTFSDWNFKLEWTDFTREHHPVDQPSFQFSLMDGCCLFSDLPVFSCDWQRLLHYYSRRLVSYLSSYVLLELRPQASMLLSFFLSWFSELRIDGTDRAMMKRPRWLSQHSFPCREWKVLGLRSSSNWECATRLPMNLTCRSFCADSETISIPVNQKFCDRRALLFEAGFPENSD